MLDFPGLSGSMLISLSFLTSVGTCKRLNLKLIEAFGRSNIEEGEVYLSLSCICSRLKFFLILCGVVLAVNDVCVRVWLN